jgi:hypothetical protein
MTTFDLVQKAAIALHDAAANAPERSNLRDTLEGLAGQLDEVHSTMARHGYDTNGMER